MFEGQGVLRKERLQGRTGGTLSDSSLHGGEEPREGPLPKQEGSQGEVAHGGCARG